MRRFMFWTIAVAALIVSTARVAVPEDPTGAALDGIATAIADLGTRPILIRQKMTSSPMLATFAPGPETFSRQIVTFAPATFRPEVYTAYSDSDLRRSIVASQTVLAASRARGAIASDDYTATLVADRRAIDRAAASDDDATRMRLLAAVDLDLETKAAYAKAAPPGANPLGTVTVSVDTVTSAGPQSGYDVLFNPFVEADATTARFPFPDRSSPSTHPLAPGWYVAWARKGRTTTLKQRVHINGGQGISAQHVVLDII